MTNKPKWQDQVKLQKAIAQCLNEEIRFETLKLPTHNITADEIAFRLANIGMEMLEMLSNKN
jgi:hypothetical protein